MLTAHDLEASQRSTCPTPFSDRTDYKGLVHLSNFARHRTTPALRPQSANERLIPLRGITQRADGQQDRRARTARRPRAARFLSLVGSLGRTGTGR